MSQPAGWVGHSWVGLFSAEIFRCLVGCVGSCVSVGRLRKLKVLLVVQLYSLSYSLSFWVIKYSVSTAIIIGFDTSVIRKNYTLLSAKSYCNCAWKTSLLVVLGCGLRWVVGSNFSSVMGWAGLDQSVGGLGWAGSKKMDPRKWQYYIHVLSSSWDGRPFGYNRHGPENEGCAPYGGKLDTHVTQYGVGGGLLSCQVAFWSIQPIVHADDILLIAHSISELQRLFNANWNGWICASM